MAAIQLHIDDKNTIEADGIPTDVRHRPNAETLAALREADDILSGRAPSKRYPSAGAAFDAALTQE